MNRGHYAVPSKKLLIPSSSTQSWRQQRRRGHGQRIMRRFRRTIPVGVRVEHGLQDGFQVALHDHLGDSVGDRRDAQRPSSSSLSFRYYRRAAQVVGSSCRNTSGSRPDRDSCSDPCRNPRLTVRQPSRPSVRLHLLVRLPHIAFGNTKRLGSIHAGHPLAGCRLGKAG
jgi:hypothetical protein